MTRQIPLRRRTVLAAVAALGTVGGLAACSDSDSVAEQAKGNRAGYKAADGEWRMIPADERKEPVTLSGKTLEGQQLSVEDHRGDVVVVNLWASWCGPCEAEAPHLVAAHERYAAKGDPVTFVGIDYREPSIETGRAQAKAWGLPYDSIFDKSGTSAIDMQGALSAQPSTAVLDREGRIAGIVLGATKESILTGMIDDVLAEGEA